MVTDALPAAAQRTAREHSSTSLRLRSVSSPGPVRPDTIPTAVSYVSLLFRSPSPALTDPDPQPPTRSSLASTASPLAWDQTRPTPSAAASAPTMFLFSSSRTHPSRPVQGNKSSSRSQSVVRKRWLPVLALLRKNAPLHSGRTQVSLYRSCEPPK